MGPGSLCVFLHSCHTHRKKRKKPLIYCNSGFTWVLSPPSSSGDEGTKAPRLVIQARPTMLIEVNGERMANTDPDFAEILRTQGSCNASVLYTHSNCSTSSPHVWACEREQFRVCIFYSKSNSSQKRARFILSASEELS